MLHCGATWQHGVVHRALFGLAGLSQYLSLYRSETEQQGTNKTRLNLYRCGNERKLRPEQTAKMMEI